MNSGLRAYLCKEHLEINKANKPRLKGIKATKAPRGLLLYTYHVPGSALQDSWTHTCVTFQIPRKSCFHLHFTCGEIKAQGSHLPSE